MGPSNVTHSACREAHVRKFVMSSQRPTNPSIDENQPVVASSNVDCHDADARVRFSESHQQGFIRCAVLPQSEGGM